jgi:hypothetical protein
VNRGKSTTETATTAYRSQIAISGHRGLSFELFVQLIFELATLIGDRVRLRGFRRATGMQAVLLGSQQHLLLVAHFGLQLAEMLIAHNGLSRHTRRQPAILLVRKICGRDREIVRRRAPNKIDQQREDQ